MGVNLIKAILIVEMRGLKGSAWVLSILIADRHYPNYPYFKFVYKRGKYMQKRRSKMTVQDMREIAHFHRICLNYIKIKRIEERAKNEEKVNN